MHFASVKVDNHNCDIVFLPLPGPIARPRKHFFKQGIDELLSSKVLLFFNKSGKRCVAK